MRLNILDRKETVSNLTYYFGQLFWSFNLHILQFSIGQCTVHILLNCQANIGSFCCDF